VNKIEEILYVYTMLDCEHKDCGEIYVPDVEISSPNVEEWASRNASLAIKQGWKISESGKATCPSCSKKYA